MVVVAFMMWLAAGEHKRLLVHMLLVASGHVCLSEYKICAGIVPLTDFCGEISPETKKWCFSIGTRISPEVRTWPDFVRSSPAEVKMMGSNEVPTSHSSGDGETV
jgi:hypothetical protein